MKMKSNTRPDAQKQIRRGAKRLSWDARELYRGIGDSQQADGGRYGGEEGPE